MNKKEGQIVLSNGEVANVKDTKSNYKNILIVELYGDLCGIDKETRTLAKTLGSTHNQHAYYVKKSLNY
ncbi:hypothetical protein OGZ51_12695 [Lactococcus lactis]|uniref:Uncharacterized protein n=1 Tax=Lactococcus lactis TaxID=1358 RepID=A0A9X4NJ08_9LACT|nr:hypothetical protein [Lactococcus lactis]MDG4985003.1 hypothetical protein [Lactococcus lactis]